MSHGTFSPARFRTVPRDLLVMCLVILGTGCGKSAPAQEEMDMGPMTEVTLTAEQIAHGAVKWAAVSTEVVADSVEVPGHLVPDEDRTARLSVSVRGRVTAVRANVGDAVVRGQVLRRPAERGSVVEARRLREGHGRTHGARVCTALRPRGA